MLEPALDGIHSRVDRLILGGAALIEPSHARTTLQVVRGPQFFDRYEPGGQGATVHPTLRKQRRPILEVAHRERERVTQVIEARER